MKPLLTILIPTVVGREKSRKALTDKIMSGRDFFKSAENYPLCDVYYFDSEELQIVVCKDNKGITIGEKRERLYKVAQGLFSWQIDDDDDIEDGAIDKIIEAIKSNPEVDCITFKERCFIDGYYKSCNHSLKYFQWMDNQDGYDFIRSPFYKDVIRTDIAKSVPFPHIRWNEDEQWSKALYPHLHTEIHIDEELYYYTFNQSDPIERYGLNRH